MYRSIFSIYICRYPIEVTYVELTKMTGLFPRNPVAPWIAAAVLPGAPAVMVAQHIETLLGITIKLWISSYLIENFRKLLLYDRDCYMIRII